MFEQRIYSAEILGRVIKRGRTDKRLTQKELAIRTGLAQPTISDVETGNSDVKFETLFKILSALDLDIVISVKKKNEAIW
jgi:HTH-type transcriptional regulator/antitoxin HipB